MFWLCLICENIFSCHVDHGALSVLFSLTPLITAPGAHSVYISGP